MNTKRPTDEIDSIDPTDWPYYRPVAGRTGGDIRKGDCVRHSNGDVGVVTKVARNGHLPALVTFAVGDTEYVCLGSMVCVVAYVPPEDEPAGR